jgi:hypothetical protein
VAIMTVNKRYAYATGSSTSVSHIRPCLKPSTAAPIRTPINQSAQTVISMGSAISGTSVTLDTSSFQQNALLRSHMIHCGIHWQRLALENVCVVCFVLFVGLVASRHTHHQQNATATTAKQQSRNLFTVRYKDSYI